MRFWIILSNSRRYNLKNPLKNEKNSSWIVLAIAFLATFFIIQILGWQYHRLVKEEIRPPVVKIEENMARSALKEFMAARIEKKESRVKFFLTERAMEQTLSGNVELIDSFLNFEILEARDDDVGQFSFFVKIASEDGLELLELIKVAKILDKYYIDSVEIPG